MSNQSVNRGATAVEYALMIALIAAVIVAAVSVVGSETNAGFSTFETNLNAATTL